MDSEFVELINKTNQFNLTTKRYQLAEIEMISLSKKFISLYGKLNDKFGDNGLISVVIGELIEETCIIDTWLMSCRVLKREMEFAMLDKLVQACKVLEIKKIIGVYKPTTKNKMVSKLFSDFEFTFIEKNDKGDMFWELEISNYIQKQISIKYK